jgi:CelD/BcsL family acetyltransferase involved in cellulose biosynthesis
MNAHTLNSYNEFKSFRTQWNNLYTTSESENPFLSWEWINLWLLQFPNNFKIRIVVVEKNNELLCIAPFLIKNKDLFFLSDSLFSDYMDILTYSESSDVIEKVVKTLINYSDWNRANLLTIPGFSKCLHHYKDAFAKHAIYCSFLPNHSNPFISLSGTFEDFIQSKSKGFRQDLRTTENKLNKSKDDWMFLEATTKDEKNEILDALINFHLERQVKKTGTSIFQEINNVNFYKDLIHNENLPWEIHLSGIKVGQTLITASISIITADVFYYWIPSFDTSFKGGSIGQLHIKYLLKNCFEKSILRFDFMGGTEEYKKRWTDEKYKNFQLLVYRNSSKLIKDTVWYYLRGKLQYIKDNSSVLNKIWVKISKKLGY